MTALEHPPERLKYLFNTEGISSVRKSGNAGPIQLQWWRDSVGIQQGKPPPHSAWGPTSASKILQNRSKMGQASFFSKKTKERREGEDEERKE